MAKPEQVKLKAKDEKEVQALSLDIAQITRTKSILNQNQIQKIFNSTPKRYRYDRPGKAGGTWTYVRVSYIRRVLDSLFGFNWDFEIETSLSEAFEVAKLTKSCVVKGILTGRVLVDGKYIEIKKTQFGRADVKMKKNSTEPLDFGNDMKAASSDALKKCASLLGIAADIYDPEEFQEIAVVGSDEHTERSKNIDKMTEEAKKKIKEV